MAPSPLPTADISPANIMSHRRRAQRPPEPQTPAPLPAATTQAIQPPPQTARPPILPAALVHCTHFYRRNRHTILALLVLLLALFIGGSTYRWIATDASTRVPCPDHTATIVTGICSTPASATTTGEGRGSRRDGMGAAREAQQFCRHTFTKCGVVDAAATTGKPMWTSVGTEEVVGFVPSETTEDRQSMVTAEGH